MSHFCVAVFAVAAALLVAPALPAGETQAKMQKEAKISIEKARAIALEQAPGGTIAGEKLMREHGKVVYSFAVKRGLHGYTIINVDAKTGKVVSMTHSETKD